MFSPGRALGEDRLMERDRAGRVVRSIDPKSGLEDLCLSPDGTRLQWSQRSTSGGGTGMYGSTTSRVGPRCA